MNRWMKLTLVLAGYAMAFAASTISVVLYDRGFSPADSQAMGGMIAGGEMMLGGAVFALVSMVPSGLALWFLRSNRKLWSAFSIAGLAFAIAGLGMVITLLASRGAMPRMPLLVLVDFLGLVQMMGAPLWIGSFLVFAALAPARDLRRRMLVAAAIEGVVGACGLVHFLVATAPI